MNTRAISTRRTGSYDSVAETYDRVSVPHIFVQPATDLVRMLGLQPPAKVIDVGAGTGISAAILLKDLGPGGVVVALDPSLGMLRLARRKGLRRLVAGRAAGLPFKEAVFDGAVASFVLSHMPSYRDGLLDIARVVRPGGKLAFSTWGPHRSEWKAIWQKAAETFVVREQFERWLREVLPWEEQLSDPGNLAAALREAGLEAIEVRRREYTTRMTLDEFLLSREITFQARLMRQSMDPAQWECFCLRVRSELNGRCAGVIEDSRDACLAIGTRPAR